MSDKPKELRRMNRSELIEIIYAQQRREKTLVDELEAAKAKLAERAVVMENAGSIAEAALKLNRVFQDAQAAADQYLLSLRAMHEGDAAAATGTGAAVGSDGAAEAVGSDGAKAGANADGLEQVGSGNEPASAAASNADAGAGAGAHAAKGAGR